MRENGIKLAVVVALTVSALSAWAATAHTAAEDIAVADDVIECGACGAHVRDWLYVRNINDGTPVEVCMTCYSNYVDNMR